MKWDYSEKYLWISCESGAIAIKACPDGAESSIMAHTAACTDLDFDPLGRYLITCGSDAIILRWDLQSLICSQTYTNFKSPVRSVSFSFDGEYIASASDLDGIQIE